jgi:hypothetical protein
MENILRVFAGHHVIGLGQPIIVHTGWSQPIGRLFSEYFLFFKGDKQYYKRLRMGFEYSHPAPHPVKRDVTLLMEQTYDEATISIYEYVDRLYTTSGITNPQHPVLMKEVPATFLLKMYLFGVHTKELAAMQSESTSPKLRATLNRFFKVPPLVPIP